MKGKSRLLGQQGGREGPGLCRDGMQGQRLLAGVEPDGDAVMNGRADELLECFTRVEVELIVLRVTHEEALSFAQPRDAAADGVSQPSEFGGWWPGRSVKARPGAFERIHRIERSRRGCREYCIDIQY